MLTANVQITEIYLLTTTKTAFAGIAKRYVLNAIRDTTF